MGNPWWRDRVRITQLVIGAVVAAIVLYLPQQYGPSQTKLFSQAIYLAIAAMGLNLLTGYNGQVSIGHGAFFGVGAYTSAILMENHGWSYAATVPMAALVAFVIGAIVGFPALRVKGFYLALITLGLAAVFPRLVIRFVHGTGGTTLVIPPRVRAPAWAESFAPADDQWRYYLALTIGVVLLLVAANLVRGGFGRALIAVRDHEAAAATVGIDLVRVKVSAFALSALYAGVAGSLSVLIDGQARSSQIVYFRLSIEFLVAVVIGGAATVLGPVLGAGLLVFLQQWTEDLTSKDIVSPAIFGVALILLMYVLPDGLVGGAHRLAARLRRPRPPTPVEAVT